MSTQDYAPKRKINSFYPPQRHLMGPGPSEIHPRVFSAMGKPTIGYLDPIFVEMMEELKELLRYAFQTLKLVIEPGGSVALAALLTGKIDAKGKTVGVVVSGGNVDPELYARILKGEV